MRFHAAHVQRNCQIGTPRFEFLNVVCHFASACSHSTAVADDRVDVQVAHCRTCHATRIEVRQQRRLRQTADSVVEAGQNVDVSSLVQSTDELNPLVAAERVADE